MRTMAAEHRLQEGASSEKLRPGARPFPRYSINKRRGPQQSQLDAMVRMTHSMLCTHETDHDSIT
jgi:hypothetical protein